MQNFFEKNKSSRKEFILNIEDQRDLSSYYYKMNKVPSGPKRVKLSNLHGGIDDNDLKEI